MPLDTIRVDGGSTSPGCSRAPAVPCTQCGGQTPPYAAKRVVRAGCQSREATPHPPRAANRSAAGCRSGSTASPSGTASAPPGQKSFCTSTTTSASLRGSIVYIEGPPWIMLPAHAPRRGTHERPEVRTRGCSAGRGGGVSAAITVGELLDDRRGERIGELLHVSGGGTLVGVGRGV